MRSRNSDRPAGFELGSNSTFTSQNKYKKIPNNKSNNYLTPVIDSFAEPEYFETFQTFQKLCNFLKKIHHTKITNEKLTNEQTESGIYSLSEFRDAFNKDYSSILGTKITLLISSHKWNKLYQDKNQKLPTVAGIFDQ